MSGKTYPFLCEYCQNAFFCIVKAEPALQRFNMLHMHSKQYLHLLFATLQALKTRHTDKKQIQFGLIAADASQKHDGFNWLISVRARCKHVVLNHCTNNITVMQNKTQPFL